MCHWYFLSSLLKLASTLLLPLPLPSLTPTSVVWEESDMPHGQAGCDCAEEPQHCGLDASTQEWTACRLMLWTLSRVDGGHSQLLVGAPWKRFRVAVNKSWPTRTEKSQCPRKTLSEWDCFSRSGTCFVSRAPSVDVMWIMSSVWDEDHIAHGWGGSLNFLDRVLKENTGLYTRVTHHKSNKS